MERADLGNIRGIIFSNKDKSGVELYDPDLHCAYFYNGKRGCICQKKGCFLLFDENKNSKGLVDISGLVVQIIKWIYFDFANKTYANLCEEYYNGSLNFYKNLSLNNPNNIILEKDIEASFIEKHLEDEKNMVNKSIKIMEDYFGRDWWIDLFYFYENVTIDDYVRKYFDFVKSKIKGQSKQEQNQIPDKLNTPNIIGYFKQAIEIGLMSTDYVWLKSNRLLAYFAFEISRDEGLGKGAKMGCWKPFEELFGVKDLRVIYAEIEKNKDGTLADSYLVDVILKK